MLKINCSQTFENSKGDIKESIKISSYIEHEQFARNTKSAKKIDKRHTWGKLKQILRIELT